MKNPTVFPLFYLLNPFDKMEIVLRY